jgi:hypothetical protein
MMNTVVYDSENPDTLHGHVVCKECLDGAAMDETRMDLIWRLSGREIEDRDLEQLVRLHNHLFGLKKDPKLTAAGFYSLTLRQRKKIKRQLDEEFGPEIPEA